MTNKEVVKNEIFIFMQSSLQLFTYIHVYNI